MKNSQNKLILSVLALIAGILAVFAFVLHAQETTTLDATPIQIGATDEEVMLQAIEATTPLPAIVATNGSNFYSAQHAPGSEEEWPPLPGDVLGLDVWPLGDGYYVLDDRNVDYNALQAKPQARGGMQTMNAMQSSGVGGDGSDSGGNGVSPANSPVYGTNLWLSIAGLSNSFANLFLENTTPDIQYEIQSIQDLTQTGWISEGFVWGSEITNWTPKNVAQNNRTNLFFRIRSWADDGSGLPIWWQLQYFGTTGINPNALDSANDGWTIYQKYQMGLDPNVFYTPPAPKGLIVFSYSAGTSTATLNWLPSPGPVTGYTIQTPSGNFNISPNTFVDSTSSLSASYRVQAHYTGGNSAWSAPVSVPSNFSIFAIAGPQGSAYLVIPALPTGAKTIRITRDDLFAEGIHSDYSFDTNFDISVSNITNAFCLIPASCVNGPKDSYGLANYLWSAQILDTNNNAISQSSDLNSGYGDSSGASSDWLVPPYFDGRAELKQDLIFQLRAANATNQFQLKTLIPDVGDSSLINFSPNYVYEGFYSINNENLIYGVSPVDSPWFDVFLPFEDNYMFRNYVYSTADLDSSGNITTGVQQDSFDTNLVLWLPPTYLFEFPLTNQTPIASMLSTNTSRWLCMSPLALNFSDDNSPIGFSPQIIGSDLQWTLNNNVRNYWGLPFLSAEVYYSNLSGNLVNGVFNAGNSFLTLGDNFPVYMETAQPRFQTVAYDFWNQPPWYYGTASTNPIPGMASFSTSKTSDLLITSVGNPNFNIVSYAKLAITNSYYSGIYGYLGQYFDQAYQINTNGVVTTNTTGVLSPYGQFFATQPGPVALVTIPDIDTGARGTCTVYCVSLALDQNHDGSVDTSFNGADATSVSSPYTLWCNNNYDRYVLDEDDNTSYDDDVKVQDSPGTTDQNTPDCNYLNGVGHRVIPCERDLQDFARLWVCGVTSNLLAALPAGSTVTLNWGDVGFPNSGNPTIDLFQAADSDGGIGYLTNNTIAGLQINSLTSAYVGRLAPGVSLQLNASLFSSWAGNHFIWCGVANGNGQLNLTIADASGNVLAQASQWIQIVDIKQMYERWTVGDQPSITPVTNAIPATENLPVGASAFQYSLPQVTNTPYILFVHGWNMESWEKDRFAESAFKRLYWQGYRGRFGSFRWPTYNGFTGSTWQTLTDPRNFDNSEFIAWQSAAGLANKLISLNAEYPNHVYMLAHSMGNIVAGEALRLARSNQVVNTYVASQAAIPAHDYDATVTTPYLLPFTYTYPSGLLNLLGSRNYGPSTPNIYGNLLTNNVGATGRRINYYNENDFALAMPRWGFDQILKPDTLPIGTYVYTGSTNDAAPWNHFGFTPVGGSLVMLDIVNSQENHYEAISYAAEPRSTALGATPSVLNISANFDLTTIWPPDSSGHNYADHFWHSAEFRGDYWQQQIYWHTLLFSSSLGFNISNP